MNVKRITLLFIFLVCVVVTATLRWGNEKNPQWDEAFSSIDSRGYFDYLPKIFFQRELNYPSASLPFVDSTASGNINQYFIGAPVLWSPFYFAALVYEKIRGENSDGYSASYKRSILIAGIFWLMVGLICLAEVMTMLGLRPGIISLSLLLIVFGTNLFYYAVLFPVMTHVYSFSLLAVFLYTGMKYFRTAKKIFLLLTGIAFGLSVITRPTTLLLLPCLIPFVAGDIKNIRTLFIKPIFLFPVLTVASLIIFIQCAAWHAQTGHWFVRSYSGGGFYFFHPEIFNVLFSFQKGWFVYTPLALIALTGLLVLYRKNKFGFYSVLIATAAWIYIVSAWWWWDYADSFGHRAFIDIYPLVAILLALALSELPKIIHVHVSIINEKFFRGALLSFCFVFLMLNLIQSYQAQNKILHLSSMDWQRYKYVFLKTSDSYKNCLGGIADPMPYSRKEPQRIFSSHIYFSKPVEGWTTLPVVMLNQKPAIHFNGDEFGAELKIPAERLLNTGRFLYANVRITRMDVRLKSSAGALWVNAATNEKGATEHYYAFPFNNIPSQHDSDLQTFQSSFIVPALQGKNSVMHFYLWNQARGDFYVTGLSVELYRVFP